MKGKMLQITWTQYGVLSETLPSIGPSEYLDRSAIKRTAEMLLNRLPEGVDITSVRFEVLEYGDA